MSATATRTAQAAPDFRQLGVAIGALLLAVALLVAVTVSQRVTTQSSAAISGSAPVMHDHGWSVAPAAVAPMLFDRGLATAVDSPVINAQGWVIAPDSKAIDAGRHNLPAGLPTIGSGTFYTGIPYTPTRESGSGGSNGTRFAR